MSAPGSTKPKRTTRWLIGALVVANALLVGVTVLELRSGGERARGPAGAAAAAGPAARSAGGGPLSIADETPPWRAFSTNRSALPAGTVPLSQIDPPPPDPSLLLPPAPEEPPNPAQHRPSIHNPGGVNGDRPERPVPGLE